MTNILFYVINIHVQHDWVIESKRCNKYWLIVHYTESNMSVQQVWKCTRLHKYMWTKTYNKDFCIYWFPKLILHLIICFLNIYFKIIFKLTKYFLIFIKWWSYSPTGFEVHNFPVYFRGMIPEGGLNIVYSVVIHMVIFSLLNVLFQLPLSLLIYQNYITNYTYDDVFLVSYHDLCAFVSRIYFHGNCL